MKKKLLLVFAFLIFTLTLCAKEISVCAAENFYGNLAELIGKEEVKVTSIISNPDADPHLFATSPQTAILISKAEVIIYNGADYDPWMEGLISARRDKSNLTIINVAKLMSVKDGENPHIWYKPETFSALASKLCSVFSEMRPEKKIYFEENLKDFNEKYQAVYDMISFIKSKYPGIQVTATEPVFGYMAEALGFTMKGTKYQWVIMNDSEPSPKLTAQFMRLLTIKTVKLLFYNSQVTSPSVRNIKKLAQINNIPIVGVTETMPQNISVIEWMTKTLQDVKNALEKSVSK